MALPTCFVLMPFGQKLDPQTKRLVDFDPIFEEAIAPAIRDAGLDPMRGDMANEGGFIHKNFFEKLLLCDFAVADLTTQNANVFYEFGVRHAVRPRSTIAVTAHPEALPFDVKPLQALTYSLDRRNRLTGQALSGFRETLTAALQAAKTRLAETAGDPLKDPDSPIYQLIKGFVPPDLSHLRADFFADRLNSEKALSEEIAEIRRRMRMSHSGSRDEARAALDDVSVRIDADPSAPWSVRMELMMGYRAISAWDRVVEVYEALPKPLQDRTLAREQYGMALNRLGNKGTNPAHSLRALDVLEGLERERGADSETCGLIGRVYKDLWLAARAKGDPAEMGFLGKAVSAYRRGFNADWRDTYPGINLATLLSAQGTRKAMDELDTVLPVVRYGAMRELESDRDDYWQHATLLEIAVLERNAEDAEERFGDALAHVTEHFQRPTTANNLRIILETASDAERLAFLPGLITKLEEKADEHE